MLLRAHYIIDLVTGFLLAHYLSIYGEKFIYFVDVLLLGSGHKERFSHYYKPCKKCGWTNVYSGNFMCEEEKASIKELYRRDKANYYSSDDEEPKKNRNPANIYKSEIPYTTKIQ